ncbi:hypothetical protein X727_23350 [Mesorhizobium sp. L103C119B0]|nr:hypothetical protein X727_23350 [Mesorhizobium sp. L103C119B0]
MVQLISEFVIPPMIEAPFSTPLPSFAAMLFINHVTSIGHPRPYPTPTGEQLSI